jgi:hypothetical protein
MANEQTGCCDACDALHDFAQFPEEVAFPACPACGWPMDRPRPPLQHVPDTPAVTLGGPQGLELRL